MHSPTKRHLEAAYHILRYLKGTPGKGMLLKKSKDRGIRSFADADWAGSIEDSKSTLGYCTKIWGNLVIWRSKKQEVVSCSSVEVKYRTIAQCICEVILVERFMEYLSIPITEPKVLYSYSKSTISIENNPV